MAIQVAELYGETKTVCDLATAHRLPLTDELLAAHMLVLWSVTDDFGVARAAIQTKSVTALIALRLRERVGDVVPERWSKRAVIALLWRVRGLAVDTRGLGASSVVGTVVRPGRGAKQFIKRAELQLGVR
jgi:hypothetical protein